MELSKQVCSLELSKQLKQLGVKQESYFTWVGEHVFNGTELSDPREIPNGVWISAFTVAELVEILGNTIHEITRYNNGEWSVYETPSTTYPSIHMERATTLIEALAKMLIYLLENKLIN